MGGVPSGELGALSTLLRSPALQILGLPFMCIPQAFFQVNVLLNRSGCIQRASKKFKVNIL